MKFKKLSIFTVFASFIFMPLLFTACEESGYKIPLRLFNVRYLYGAQTLAWDETANADGYSVKMKFGGSTLLNDNLESSATSCIFDASLFADRIGTFTFELVALGSGDFANSQPYVIDWDRSKTPLAAPQNIRFDFAALSLTWDAVTGAASYTILTYSYDDQTRVYTLVDTINDIKSENYQFITFWTPMVFEVIACPVDTINNENSPVVKKEAFYKKLAKPEGFSYVKHSAGVYTLSWDTDPEAQNYLVTATVIRTNATHYVTNPIYTITYDEINNRTICNITSVGIETSTIGSLKIQFGISSTASGYTASDSYISEEISLLQ